MTARQATAAVRKRRVVHRAALIGLAIVGATACSPSSPDAGVDGEWVGTITTEGNVTTVINESGSVWGGPARLVEEASIGVEIGEPHYMFGRVTSITADDERIYVAETQPPVVRVYGRDGNHLLDIGSEGQGPGELKYPTSVSLLPNGNVLVRDDDNSRFTEFSRQGELVGTWPGWTRAFGSLLPSFVNPDGTVYFPAVVGRDPETNEGRWGYWRWGPEGKTGEDLVRPEIDYQRPTLEVGTRETSIPMSPEVVTQFAPFGAWITGVSDQYRFEIRHFDGRVTVVERRVDRVPMSDEERAWRMKSATASFRNQLPDWSWNGPPIAEHLPTFSEFNVDRENRIWVLTLAPSTPVPGCDADPQPGERSVPCWRLAYRPDVFATGGKYLGPVELPPEIAGSRLFDAYISDRDLITSMQDEAGTIMVKRYGLLLPGE